jgi:hypothetical protein
MHLSAIIAVDRLRRLRSALAIGDSRSFTAPAIGDRCESRFGSHKSG